jgi:FAD/FMN-containing dehydrogenase
MPVLTRTVFRGQVGSAYGKRLRWQAEKHLGGMLANRPLFRNELLGEPVDVFENQSADSTDILHEYFVPPSSFEAFVEEVRSIVPRHKGDLLNVTVRHVLQDDDTFLRYADRDMFALVMLFNQPRTPEGDAAVEPMTRELIDAAVRLGGRYYLPYRLHATPDQLRAAYPQARHFFEMKRRYDPRETFQSSFYVRYALGRSP